MFFICVSSFLPMRISDVKALAHCNLHNRRDAVLFREIFFARDGIKAGSRQFML
jgi:hypothetical protein